MKSKENRGRTWLGSFARGLPNRTLTPEMCRCSTSPSNAMGARSDGAWLACAVDSNVAKEMLQIVAEDAAGGLTLVFTGGRQADFLEVSRERKNDAVWCRVPGRIQGRALLRQVRVIKQDKEPPSLQTKIGTVVVRGCKRRARSCSKVEP